MKTPQVSILLPVYNGKRYLVDSLESVTSQVFTDWELIVVDDGSTDTSSNIIQEFIKKDARISYFYQSNAGVASALNRGINRATGKYISLMSSDDLWNSNYLKIITAVLNNNNNYGVAYADHYYMFGNKRSERRWSDGYPLQDGDISRTLINHNIVSGLTTTFRRQLLKRIGFFDLHLKIAEDYDLWLRMSLSGVKFKSINEPLGYYRKHNTNLTGNAVDYNKSLIRIYEKILKNKNINPHIRNTSERKLKYFRSNLELILMKQRLFDKPTKKEVERAILYYKSMFESGGHFSSKLASVLLRCSPKLFLFAYKTREMLRARL